MKKISDKRKAQWEAEKQAIRDRHRFFIDLWDDLDEKDKVCAVTGKRLGKEPLSTYFHHILPKAKYPEYEFCRWNIIILDPDIHNQVETNISKVPKVESIFIMYKSSHDEDTTHLWVDKPITWNGVLWTGGEIGDEEIEKPEGG